MAISMFLLIASMVILWFASVTWLSFYLGKTKTENPKVAALIGFMLGFLPPLELIYLSVLTLKNDVDTV
jgi:hypothetical protein